MKFFLLPCILLVVITAVGVSFPCAGRADDGIASIATSTAPGSAPSVTTTVVPETVLTAPQEKPADPPLANTHAVTLGTLVLRDDFNNRGVVGFAEFEKRLSRRFALFARVGRIEYRPNEDTGHYGEGGRGNGIELGGRVYLALKEKVSFYLGAGIGGWRLNWYWKDEEKTPFETTGRRSSRASSFQVHAGWKIRLGSGTSYVNPSIQIGSFFPRRDDDPMEFGEVYTGIGLALGKAW
jgi:opacity protein-like surface antigen